MPRPRHAAALAALLVALTAPPGARAAAAAPDPAATAALCAARPEAEREVCAQFCTAWPADPTCALVRRWGTPGLNVLVRVHERAEPWDAAARAEGLAPTDALRLRMHADFGGFSPGPWDPPRAPRDPARAVAAEAALQRGVASARAGDTEGALASLAEAARAYADAFGPGARRAAIAHQNRGHLLAGLDRHAEAQAELDAAREILAALLPPDHPNLAVLDVELAGVEHARGDVRAAATRLARAHDALRRVLGEDAPLTLTALNNLAAALADQDRLAEAAPLRAALVAGRRAVSGPEHPDTATAEMNLGVLALSQGRPGDARATLAPLAARVEARLGPNDPELGAYLFNLARADAALGTLDAALAGMRRALRLFGLGGPATLRELASARVGTADLLRDLGDVPAALVLYGQALDARLALFGPLHPDTAAVWARMADALLDVGSLGEARELAEQAYAAALQRGASPAELGRRRALYAAVLARAGDLAAAEGHLRQAVALLSDTLGPAHPDAVAARGSLAAVLTDRGALDEAQPLLEAVVAALVGARGAEDDSTLVAKATLAEVLAARGDAGAAVRVAAEAARDGRARLAALARAAPNPVAVQTAAAALRPVLTLERDLRLGGAVAADAFDAALAAQGAGARAERAWRAAHGGAGAGVAGGVVPSREALCRALGEERASLVLYVGGVVARGAVARGARPAVSQGAFVLSPGARCAPVWVPLGEHAAIVNLVDRWRRGLDGVKACYTKRGDPSFCAAELRAADEQGAALRAAAWDPLVAALGGARRVWIVADGALTRVAFDALPDVAGAYLLEAWELAYALGPEALVTRGAATRGEGALVVGDVDYAGTLAGAEAPEGRWRRCVGGGCEASGGGRVFAAGGEARARGAAACGYRVKWGSLGATEAPGVAAALGRAEGVGGAWLAEGASADEGALRAGLAGHRVLHFATHGFFAPPEVCSAHALDGPVEDGARARWAEVALGGGRQALVDPLRLSGLVVSGANALGAGGDAARDGLLSAREVADLDLRGTALVALSACETGLGLAESGESFQGLVGAFLGAGAERAVVSLWQVPSDTTAELFEAFYAGFAGPAGQDRPWGALLEARRALVRALAAEGLPRSAFLWGAFIPVSGVRGGF